MWLGRNLGSTLLNITLQCLHLMLDCPSHSKSFVQTCSEIELGRYIDAFQKPRWLWYIWINMSCTLEAPQYISFAKHFLHRNVSLDIFLKISEIRFNFTSKFIVDRYFPREMRTSTDYKCLNINSNMIQHAYWGT